MTQFKAVPHICPNCGGDLYQRMDRGYVTKDLACSGCGTIFLFDKQPENLNTLKDNTLIKDFLEILKVNK